ncbi:YolD-like family protein [Cohnella sp.]|uniref:YolD-like family protein n=1 Tax=Cohnella sp. TaxID=1883426 RepID=UPI0035624EE7
MRKKLEGNGLWESSRMMLPEHKERIIYEHHLSDNYKGERPEFDEEELQRIVGKVISSYEDAEPIQVRLYDPYETLIVDGLVEKMDIVSGWFQVSGDRFKFTDIIMVN